MSVQTAEVKNVAINLSSAVNYLRGGLKRRVSRCQKPRLRECCGNHRAGEEMHSGEATDDGVQEPARHRSRFKGAEKQTAVPQPRSSSASPFS